MFSLAGHSARPGIRHDPCLILLACAGSSHAAQPAPAKWFPDAPTFCQHVWVDAPSPGCEALSPQPAWRRMAALAGAPEVQFRIAPDNSGGNAHSVAPDVMVLWPVALKLMPCQLAFLVGHEIAHVARHHFDEDAMALSIYSGKPANWTRQGSEAMELVNGDFGLALWVSHLWQLQEQEADWPGVLLAAQACGCSIESGAMAYFRLDLGSGGGIAAAHAASTERIRQRIPFTESAQRLAVQATP